jgi:hypothetical protein
MDTTLTQRHMIIPWYTHVTSCDVGWQWTESHRYNRTEPHTHAVENQEPVRTVQSTHLLFSHQFIYRYIRSHGGSQHYWARYHVLKSKSHDWIQSAYLQLRRTALWARSLATAVYQHQGQNTFSKNQNFEFGGFFRAQYTPILGLCPRL